MKKKHIFGDFLRIFGNCVNDFKNNNINFIFLVFLIIFTKSIKQNYLCKRFLYVLQLYKIFKNFSDKIV